jgi:hypothetical protein
MRSISKRLQVLGAALALGLSAHAAAAHSAHRERVRVSPAAHAYARYGRVASPSHAYAAYGTKAEEFYGTSVPYDPDGPGWNDFQLQGTN